MKQPARSNSNKLAQLYFFALVQNPLAVEPPGLDAETATLIRRLVWEEQQAGVSPSYRLNPAKERVWQEIMAQTSQLPAWPPVGAARVGRTARPFDYVLPERFDGFNRKESLNEIKRHNAPYGWSQWLVKAGMVATVIMVSLGFLLMVLNNNNAFNSDSAPVLKPGAGKIPPPLVQPGRGDPASSPKVAPSLPPKVDKTRAVPVPEINLKELVSPALADLSQLLGLTPVELLQEIQAGATLSQLASNANINLALLKETLTASFKRQLDEGVNTGQWTQAQADKAMLELPTFIDQFFNNK